MIVLGTTFTYFALKEPGYWSTWLSNLDALRDSTDHEVKPFVAFESDRRGLSPAIRALDEVVDRGGAWWEYSLNDGRASIDMVSRIRHISLGQSLCMEYASDLPAAWLAVCAADFTLPEDGLVKLLQVNQDFGAQALGVRVPSHHSFHTRISGVPGPYPLEEHTHHAGFFMLHHDLYSRFRSRMSGGYGDEFALNEDLNTLGTRMLYRTDVVGRHYPEHVTPYEQRYTVDDLKVIY